MLNRKLNSLTDAEWHMLAVAINWLLELTLLSFQRRRKVERCCLVTITRLTTRLRFKNNKMIPPAPEGKKFYANF